MRLSILLFVFSFCCLGSFAQSPTWSWADACGNNGETRGNDVAADNQDNVYITGYFKDSMGLGSVKLASSGGKDIFVAKYDNNGGLLWVVKAGGSGDDEGKGITIGGNGIYVTGYSSANASFGNQSVNNFGLEDIFIARYDLNGNISWVKNAGTDLPDEGYKIKADNKGHLFVTGFFGNYGTQPYVYKTAVFDTCSVTSKGDGDVFIAKYDTTGNAIWARGGGGKINDYSGGCDIDSQGNIYLFGTWDETQTCSFDQVQINYFGAGFLLGNLFLVKYDSNGNALWGRGIGALGSQTSIGSQLSAGMISVSPLGNIYITGTNGNCDIRFHNGIILYDITGTGEIFTAKYNTNGNLIWARKAGGYGDDEAIGIAIDDNENSYITGDFGSVHLVFHNGDTLFKVGSYDLFVASYDSIGNVRWLKNAGDTGATIGNSIRCSNTGNEIFVTGYFGGNTASFDNILLNNSGGLSIFVAKLATNTAVNNVLVEGSARVFPNPSSQVVTVISQDPFHTVTMYDYTGKKVFERSLPGYQTETGLPCSHLPGGVYLIQLQTKHGALTKQVLVQH